MKNSDPDIKEPKVLPIKKPLIKPNPSDDPWKLPKHIPFPKIKPKA
jgi:hypothetical protein